MADEIVTDTPEATVEAVTPEVTEAPSKGFITMIEDAAIAVGEDVEEELAKVWDFLSETTKTEIAYSRELMKKMSGR